MAVCAVRNRTENARWTNEQAKLCGTSSTYKNEELFMTRTQFDQELEERLVRYCRIDTQADEKSATSPSTAIQFDLLNLLVEELKEIGAQEVTLTDYGAVLATIPATVATSAPVIALSGACGHRARLQRHRRQADRPSRYDGGDIVLPDDPSQVLSPQAVALSGDQDRRRYRHRQRDDAAGRRRQGRRCHRHGCGPPSAGAPGDPARQAAHRLHARRGDRSRRAQALARRPRRHLRLHP
jgi:hypothetical protein